MPTKFIEFGGLIRRQNNYVRPTIDENYLRNATNALPAIGGYQAISQVTSTPLTNTIGSTTDTLLNTHDVNDTGFIALETAGVYYFDLSTNPPGNFVSITGSYSTNESYNFCNWGSTLIYTQGYSAPVSASSPYSSFSTLSGSPPGGIHCATVKDFLLLANTQETGGGAITKNRVWNSAINDISGWTAGTNLSDYTDIPSIEEIVGLIGGEYAVVFGKNEIAVMHFVNSDALWEVSVLAEGLPTIIENSMIKVGGLIYFVTNSGMMVFDGNSAQKLEPGGDTIWQTSYIRPFYSFDYNSIIFNKNSSPITAYHLDHNMFWDLSDSYAFSGTSYRVIGQVGNETVHYYLVGGSGIGNFISSNSGLAEFVITTGYYRFSPNSKVTIKSARLIGGNTGDGVTLSIGASESPSGAPSSTKSLTLSGKTNTRITGSFFRFSLTGVLNTFDAVIKGLEIEYTGRGSR